MVDELERFKDRWLSKRPFRAPFTEDLLYHDRSVITTTLYREGQFQVQMITAMPFTEIADHVHPSVDSFEVYVGGQIEFRHNGTKLTRLRTVRQKKDGQCNRTGLFFRVLPTDWHGATFGELGGVFLSIQHWIDIPVTSVHKNWKFPSPEMTERNFRIGEN